jgi:hypothetical protein
VPGRPVSDAGETPLRLPVQARMPPPPLDCPAGWHPAPPDFIGVGTMRSGTSWWHHLISRHPDVARLAGRDKELHYFGQFALGGVPDPSDYSRYFPRPAGKIAGEWTPRYIVDYWTPGLISDLAPTAKILVMLRDPVDRLISGVSYTQEGGRVGAVQLNLQLLRSQYCAQLENVLNYFPREQILILQYEKCVADIQRELNRTLEFLGLDPGKLPFSPSMQRPVNELRADRVTFSDRSLAAARTALQPDLQRLGHKFPDVDQSLWRSCR